MRPDGYDWHDETLQSFNFCIGLHSIHNIMLLGKGGRKKKKIYIYIQIFKAGLGGIYTADLNRTSLFCLIYKWA